MTIATATIRAAIGIQYWMVMPKKLNRSTSICNGSSSGHAEADHVGGVHALPASLISAPHRSLYEGEDHKRRHHNKDSSNQVGH
jgi:hypothetical protein